MSGLFMISCSGDSRNLFKNNDKTQLVNKSSSEDDIAAAGKGEDSTTKDKNTDNTVKQEEPEGTAKSQNIEPDGKIESQNTDSGSKAKSQNSEFDKAVESQNKETNKTMISQNTKQKEDSTVDKGTKESDSFYYVKLSDEIIDRITGKSYKKNCDIPYGELRYAKVLYWGFDEKSHEGELIVNKSIAEDIVDIFKELYHKKYPIERMVLVDDYDADDDASMAADNTSSFNYRNVDGTEHLSMHSYGLAIDINPLYNPYVRTIHGKSDVLPKNGTKYADRSRKCPYYIDTDDACYQAFIKRGFTWGGSWTNSKDYQHFQKKP